MNHLALHDLPKVPAEEEAGPRSSRLQERRRSVGAWLSDSGRLWRELLSLNFRKTLFRLRRDRVRCPCQNPSDSGRAWETGCDPVANWHSPERFRRLCPLLKQNPAGAWRCSVNTAEVRPFWGRACLYYFFAGAGAYAAAAFAAFLFLHTIGYPVQYRSVAWPPAWHQIREARARYYFDKAGQALRANKPIEAIMSLSQSYELDPMNYPAGRLLAQLWQPSGAEVSNRVYQQLMRDHPSRREETAQAWYAALLARGDFAAIETLALERLPANPQNPGGWLNVFLFANRRTRNSDTLGKAVSISAGLAPFIAQVCAWESALRQAGPDEVRRALTQGVPADAAPYLLYYRVDRLLRSGLASDALLQLNQVRDQLAVRDRLTLYLDTYALVGWEQILSDQINRLLATNTNAPFVELLSAHLIRHPDPKILAALFAAINQHPLAADPERFNAYLSFFFAASVAGDAPRQQAAVNAIKALAGGKFPPIDMIAAWFREDNKSVPIERLLPTLPALPTDVSYALFEFAERRLAAQNAARPVARAAATAP